MSGLVALIVFLSQLPGPLSAEVFPGDGTSLGRQLEARQVRSLQDEQRQAEYQRFAADPKSVRWAALAVSDYATDYMRAANNAFRTLCDYDDVKAMADTSSQAVSAESAYTLARVRDDLHSACRVLVERREFLLRLAGPAIVGKCDADLAQSKIDVGKLLENAGVK